MTPESTNPQGDQIMSEKSYVYIRVTPLAEFGANAGTGPSLPISIELTAVMDYAIADFHLPPDVDIVWEMMGAGGGGGGSPVGLAPGGGGGGGGAYVRFTRKVSDMPTAATLRINAKGVGGAAAADGTASDGVAILTAGAANLLSAGGGFGGEAVGGFGGLGGEVTNDAGWDTDESASGTDGETSLGENGGDGGHAFGPANGGHGGMYTDTGGGDGRGPGAGGGGGAPTVGTGGDAGAGFIRLTFSVG